MVYIKHRLFWAWNFEKEEKWLNNMSEQGLQLVDVGFCKYVFKESISCKYTYRIELLKHFPMKIQSEAYLNFLEETGVEHIGSSMRWVYLRRESNENEFDLFSDIDSRIKHLKLILTLLLCLFLLEISYLGMNILNSIMGSTVKLAYVLILTLILVVLSSGILKLYKKIGKLKKERIMRE